MALHDCVDGLSALAIIVVRRWPLLRSKIIEQRVLQIILEIRVVTALVFGIRPFTAGVIVIILVLQMVCKSQAAKFDLIVFYQIGPWTLRRKKLVVRL